MQSPNNAWSDLLLKYLADTISGPELEELHRQIGKSAWKKEQFLRVSDPDHFIQALREHHQVDIKKEWAKLLKKLPAGKVPVVIPFYKKPWVITTTAAVATVAAVYIMLWVFSPGKKPVNYSYVETDKKVRVNIDTVKNGVILEYCYAQVVKRGDTLRIKKLPNYNEPFCTYLTVATAPGKMWVIEFSDGSVASLNASTTITFPGFFYKDKRHVEILAGEGCFDVVKNDMAPFIVRTKGVTIQTLGTKFNVSAYLDAPIKTTLINGSIKLTARENLALLQPGQQARYNKNNFEVIDSVDLEQVQAWTKNFFDFKNLSVEETMKLIGAWYGYEIIVKADLPSVTYSSMIDRSLPMMDVFRQLVPNLKITESKKKIFISEPD